jgi:hypothetical protein
LVGSIATHLGLVKPIDRDLLAVYRGGQRLVLPKKGCTRYVGKVALRMRIVAGINLDLYEVVPTTFLDTSFHLLRKGTGEAVA